MALISFIREFKIMQKEGKMLYSIIMTVVAVVSLMLNIFLIVENRKLRRIDDEKRLKEIDFEINRLRDELRQKTNDIRAKYSSVLNKSLSTMAAHGIIKSGLTKQVERDLNIAKEKEIKKLEFDYENEIRRLEIEREAVLKRLSIPATLNWIFKLFKKNK